MTSSDPTIHDLVGIGFGPANMALGALLQEEEEAPGGPSLHRCFLEARLDPCWHPGMLLEGSLIQISVLKDLVTVRNPRSRFTFLSYLEEQGRLFEFLNLKDLFPSRAEFNDYLNWVAEQLGRDVRWGRRVTAVEPVAAPPGESVEHLRVVSQDVATGATEEQWTRNVVVATGGRPWTPDGIELQPDGRAFHSKNFLPALKERFPDREAPHRFAVVGAGQSGAELFLYLITRYPNAEVTAIIRGYGYKPVDDSDFTNEIFFPSMVDFVYNLPPNRRRAVIDSYRDVNYAVVDQPLIKRIYRLLYDEKVVGKERARVLPYRRLVRLQEEPGTVSLGLEHLLEGNLEERTFDGVVLATGFRWGTRHPLLNSLAPYLETEDQGAYRMNRDYSIASRDDFKPGVYLQGYAEDTHGIGETVLSLLPIRARDIAHSVFRSLSQAKPAEPVSQVR
ncbi:MAG: SidA/IucD/PvdA family monooxygenase [Acidobacteriota bacterium]